MTSLPSPPYHRHGWGEVLYPRRAPRRGTGLVPLRLVALALLVVALPIALLTTNIRVAYNTPQLYDYAVRRYDAPALSGVSEQELRRANRELVRYFNDERPLLSLTVRDGRGEPVPLFTPEETAHLADVKALLRRLYRVQEGALAYVLVAVVAIFVWAREASVRQLAWAVLASAALTLAVVVGIAAGAILGFEDLWGQLHVLLFDNETWRFDITRHRLVQMFPEAFWFDMVMLIGAATGGELALMALAAGAYLWRSRRLSEKAPLPTPLALDHQAKRSPTF